MKKFFIIFVVLLAVWSVFIEPNILTVTSLDVEMKDLKGLKVVFVGDFHVKPYQKYNLKKVVEKINAQQPDLIVSTGDFVSGHSGGQTMKIKEISKELSSLKPKYGFYTVLGNHDWWQGGEEITQELEKSGIIVLANENKLVNIKGKKLYIAGVEDLSTRGVDLTKALKNVSAPSILLTHSPDVFPMTNSADLTLAGHTHGGQVRLPILGSLIVPSSYGQKYAVGLVKENGKKLFVTKGIGTSILPIRFNCLPEIVVINFV